MALISINGNTLDPIAQAHVLEAVAPQAVTSKETNYILVQTNAPLDTAECEQLGQTGAEIQEYVPDHTYLCRYAPTDLAPVRALPFAVWAGAYLNGFKIPPTLKPGRTREAFALAPEEAGPSPFASPARWTSCCTTTSMQPKDMCALGSADPMSRPQGDRSAQKGTR